MPMATMADAHREWHRNTGVPMGTPGCPQDACHLPDEGPYDDHTHEVQTSYGVLRAYSLDEAKDLARAAAIATGRRTVIKKVEEPVVEADPLHQTPCVCGTYDLCWGVRVATARTPRDLFRAYND